MPDINDIMRLKRNYDEFKDLSWDQLAKIAELSCDQIRTNKLNSDLETEVDDLTNELDDLQYKYDSLEMDYEHNKDIIKDCLEILNSFNFESKTDIPKLKDLLNNHY